ncbi:MAG: phospho-N-acetylmuramoyl-pentapeptide-transferase [Chloroflexota bacterium]|nr:phospho-N-acetylmuramoyl-pentapeptide-transferase [Chloroflexota bacterium]
MIVPPSLAAIVILHTGVLPVQPRANLAASLALGAVAFVMTVIIGRPIIATLKRYKIGKRIRVELPESHMVKMGTPTMGGIMIAISVVLLTAIFNLAGRLSMLLPLGVLLACAVLGAVDDMLTLVGGTRSGLTARFKFAWLFLFAMVAAWVLYGPLGLHNMFVPFVGKFDIGIIYFPIALVSVMGFANAVNLTDGLDSLAGGTAAIAFIAYGIIGYLQGQLQVVTFCFTMVGALIGFLWYNAHPAQVIMGDTGSLAIGAGLAVAAFQTGHWLILPVVGFVFVFETLSVMLQVGYFKLSHGKRIFKKAPIHHHFELIGWSETQVQMRFWLVGIAAGMLGIALALS